MKHTERVHLFSFYRPFLPVDSIILNVNYHFELVFNWPLGTRIFTDLYRVVPSFTGFLPSFT